MSSPPPAAGASPSGDAPRVGRPKRGSQTMLDMARSLGLLAVVLAATLVFVPGLLHPSKSQRFQPVGYADELAGFAQVTGKPALAPADLPAGWHANAARLTGPASAEHLHVGFVVPGGKYAGLEESAAPPATAIHALLGKGSQRVDAQPRIAGNAWQQRTSRQGELALTRTTDGVTVVVTGSATATQLRLLAGSLR